MNGIRDTQTEPGQLVGRQSNNRRHSKQSFVCDKAKIKFFYSKPKRGSKIR
jgi:hypothetical protein